MSAQFDIPEPGAEYKAALEKMLQAAQLVKDAADDLMGLVAGAVETRRVACIAERAAFGYLGNVAECDHPPPTTVGIFDEIPYPDQPEWRWEVTDCDCPLRTKLVGDGCHKCNPGLTVEYLCQRLEEMAKDCQTHDDGVLLPDVCSGFVYDDLMEAARLIREKKA